MIEVSITEEYCYIDYETAQAIKDVLKSRATERPSKFMYIVLSPNSNGNEFYLESQESMNNATVFCSIPYRTRLNSQLGKCLGFIPGNFDWNNLTLVKDIDREVRRAIISRKR